MDLTELIPPKKLFEKNWLNMILKILPRGRIWNHFMIYIPPNGYPDWSGSRLAILLSVFAAEFDRFWNKYLLLITQSIPGLSTEDELLSDWERVAGIPDECTVPGLTESERQAVVHQKITQGKGDSTFDEVTQSESWFIAYALNLGYTITISYFHDYFRVGDRVGERIGGSTSVYTWIIEGDYDAFLQCLFERDKPAYTIIDWQ